MHSSHLYFCVWGVCEMIGDAHLALGVIVVWTGFSHCLPKWEGPLINTKVSNHVNLNVITLPLRGERILAPNLLYNSSFLSLGSLSLIIQIQRSYYLIQGFVNVLLKYASFLSLLSCNIIEFMPDANMHLTIISENLSIVIFMHPSPFTYFLCPCFFARIA